MFKNDILKLLRNHLKEIRQFHVVSLAIFGSVARGEARSDSDIDVLVRFDGPATFDMYMDLKFYLEELCGRKIDLISEKALKPALKKHIDKDLIHVT